ncbi:MAG: DNA-directed RNA polymerase subunit beta [Synergistota bacterium]|nr:DNA-directed RNA polymerase subunit beta [Synergistota bacterium]OPZ39933.1 MAG: DNA-directed RNA polymerase subunit beta [Synergistetes bacterium ADurb.BinA166]
MAEFVPVSSKRRRLTFGRARDLVEIPDMIEVQRDSYDWFYQENTEPGLRTRQGLQELMQEIFPIESYDGSFALEFVRYILDAPSTEEEEARQRDLTWSRPVRATIRLENRKTRELKEEEIFLGDFPVMTGRGTFIINGTERVVVNQLARSAGVYFSKEEQMSGQEEYSAKIIPERGAWLEFSFSHGESISVNIDNRKKIPATLLLKIFGASTDEGVLDLLGARVVEMDISDDDVRGLLAAETVMDPDGGVVVQRNRLINKEHLETLWNIGRTRVKVWDADRSVALTLERDGASNIDEAMVELFKKLRPNEPARIENAREYVQSLFFDPRRYNLGRVGRYKINRTLGLAVPESVRLLQLEDLARIIGGILALTDPEREGDDIDHLGNRRVRSVGELLANQIRIGLLRMERIAKERMTTIPDLGAAMARDLINVRPIAASLREFFGSGQLSQFMDQTNPLAEVTHRRRLSALGPGGLSRERAGFEARDVHYTHYGRVCPIETPEGPNIGLVTSLSSYARLNEYGFLVTPRRKVEGGRVTGEIVFLSADEEDEVYVGMANTPVDDEGMITEEECFTRFQGNIVSVPREEVTYLDVSPKQIVSSSTALIPFLEHDDANRALMGSNMQRQAVPLIAPEAPIVGTGMEHRIARDSGSCVSARRDGTVEYVDSTRIEIRSGVETIVYPLIKFRRSNQGTIIHQKPLVRKGDVVAAGEIIADGQAIEGGELALGRNVLVAFMPWEGYNFEDAILLSERLVKEDFYSSIHIEEYETEARDTKLGPEEITRDIPNVGEDVLKNLDEEGIVRVGAEVSAGDILVGKVSPKGESDQTPEEKLLRAIFGEKAREVRDTSLKVPHGARGKVVAVKQMTREDSPDALGPGVNMVVKIYVAQLRKITVGDKMAGRHGNKGVVSRILPVEDMPYLPDGTPVDVVLNPLGVPSRMNLGQVLETIMGFVAMHNGWRVASPVFEGADEDEIFDLIQQLPRDKYPDLTADGMTTLYDGRTGDRMEKKVTVGCMYMLKLIHLVDDKIHARSIGPYSLITQQPLGGKAQFGGQRFGEMEVWALEGYGAANILQEMLTVKSDDIRGRLKTYERIVKGHNLTKPGVPESFRVLVKELQGLGLDVEVKYSDGTIGELLMDDDEEEAASARRAPRERVVFDDDEASSEADDSAGDKPFDEEFDEIVRVEDIFEGGLPEGMSIEEEGDDDR